MLGVGPRYALDTARYFIVCVNYIGSCYGSSCPIDALSHDQAPLMADFPVVSIRDNVRLQRRLLLELGVTRVELAVGGSLGGMLALEWGACYCDFVQRIAVIAAPALHSGWAIGLGEVGRRAIYADAKWRAGRYPLDDPPLEGLAVARQLAMISYRSPASLDSKFGRATAAREVKPRQGSQILNHPAVRGASREQLGGASLVPVTSQDVQRAVQYEVSNCAFALPA